MPQDKKKKSGSTPVQGSPPPHSLRSGFLPLWSLAPLVLILILLGATLLSDSNALSSRFYIFFSISVLVFTILVDVRSLFLTAASVPILYFFTSAVLAMVFMDTSGNGDKRTEFIAALYPSIENYPWLIFITGACIALAIIRVQWAKMESKATELPQKEEKRSSSLNSHFSGSQAAYSPRISSPSQQSFSPREKRDSINTHTIDMRTQGAYNSERKKVNPTRVSHSSRGTVSSRGTANRYSSSVSSHASTSSPTSSTSISSAPLNPSVSSSSPNTASSYQLRRSTANNSYSAGSWGADHLSSSHSRSSSASSPSSHRQPPSLSFSSRSGSENSSSPSPSVSSGSAPSGTVRRYSSQYSSPQDVPRTPSRYESNNDGSSSYTFRRVSHSNENYRRVSSPRRSEKTSHRSDSKRYEPQQSRKGTDYPPAYKDAEQHWSGTLRSRFPLPPEQD